MCGWCGRAFRMGVIHSSCKALKMAIISLLSKTVPLQGVAGWVVKHPCSTALEVLQQSKADAKALHLGSGPSTWEMWLTLAVSWPFSERLRPSKCSCIRGDFPLQHHWLPWRGWGFTMPRQLFWYLCATPDDFSHQVTLQRPPLLDLAREKAGREEGMPAHCLACSFRYPAAPLCSHHKGGQHSLPPATRISASLHAGNPMS